MGIGLTEPINHAMEMAQAGAQSGGNIGEDTTVFRNPTVNLAIASSATVLIIAPVYWRVISPARKAVKVTAIEAMRTE